MSSLCALSIVTAVICPTNEVDKIITDDGVSKEDIQKAKELDVPLVIA